MSMKHFTQNTSRAKLKSMKLPLAVAVSTCFLAACSSSPKAVITPTAIGTPTTSTPTQATTVATPVWNNQAGAWNQPAQSSAILDNETLSILEDLLEARDMSMVEGDRIAVQRYGNLWDRVRRGYRLSQPNYSERIEAQKSWFSSRQSYLDRLTARASRYLYHTVTEAERRGIPTELALLPIIESSYDPSATSNAAAAGLWQFIPSTGRIYGLNQSNSYDGRRDVIESTRAAYDFLTSLYNQFGSWELALAAYNAGPGRIQRAIDANRAQGLPTDYWSLRLPTETMNYVPRFMAVAQIIGAPHQYGVSLPAIANHAHFRTVSVNEGVSLQEVSNVTGVPVSELQLLNPALTALRVDRAGPTRVVIPDSLSSTIDTRLRALPGYGYTQNTVAQNTAYIAPETAAASPNTVSAQELRTTNTLPTTAAIVTANNTVMQEPPLSAEERAFISEQIRLNTPEPVQVINPTDGGIELNAVQTGQSVLDARGQTRALQFDSNSTLAGVGTQSGSQTVAPNRPAVVDGVYVVQRGDTLSGIAARHGVTVAQLREWNQMSENSVLLANSRLKVSAAAAARANNSSDARAITTTRADSYTVQAGDTLTGVAAKHGLTVAQLASYNNLETNAGLLRGQKLSLVPNRSTATTARTTTPSRTTTRTGTYRVQPGDTLIGVANRLGTTPTEIAALNNFTASDGLVVGQTINVPATSAAASTPARTAPTRATTYRVQSGDTLIGVANRHGVSVAELAAANNLATNAGLVSGRTLTIPAAGSTRTTSTTTTPATTSAGQTIRNTEAYQVKSGDTLTSLSSRFGVSIADLARTNNLATNARLTAGQTIKVPKLTTTHTVKSGENMTTVARRYGITTAELAKMNNMNASDGLRIGQVLTVPNK